MALKFIEKVQLCVSHLSSEAQRKCIVNVTASTRLSLMISKHYAFSTTKHFSIFFLFGYLRSDVKMKELQNKPGKPVSVFPAQCCLKVQVLRICEFTQFLFLGLAPKLE